MNPSRELYSATNQRRISHATKYHDNVTVHGQDLVDKACEVAKFTVHDYTYWLNFSVEELDIILDVSKPWTDDNS